MVLYKVRLQTKGHWKYLPSIKLQPTKTMIVQLTRILFNVSTKFMLLQYD